MSEMAWVWLAALVIFAIVEASTVTLVSIWFVGGSLAALIAALLGADRAVEWEGKSLYEG